MGVRLELVNTVSLLAVLALLSCSNNPGPSESDTQEIPLDGRGGGVIVYCYQPLQAELGLHQIYGINADGSGNKKLCTASIGLNHEDVSPDGARIVAVGYVGANNSTWSVYVFNFDGTGLTRLTATENVWDSDPVWSPEGTRIAFTRIYPTQNSREEVWLMHADGTGQQYTGVSGFAPRWSPDGSRFVYSSRKSGNSEIYTCRTDGTDEVKLTSTAADEMYPMWSPDGSQIAYSASTGNLNDFSSNRKTYEIYIMNGDGSNVRRLTNNTDYDATPRWSPSGTSLAFESDRHEANTWEIYTLNIDGSNVRRLTTSPANVTAINPVWKPAQ